MRYEVAGFSEAGPRPSNEDAFEFWNIGSALLAEVADGLGGMGGGGQASKYVIEFMRENLQEELLTVERLASTVLDAHSGLVEQQALHPDVRSMATTLTVVHLNLGNLVAAHCGDTRLYLARGNGIKKLSDDHSEGQRLFREGLLTRQELHEYPRKHILESALGIPGAPVIQKIEYQTVPGDWVLITSDGAHEKLAMADMRDIGKSTDEPAKFIAAARELIEHRAPRDNYTLIAIKISGQQ